MSTPLGGGHIIFAFSAVRRPTWFPDILGNSSYPIFTKFGMQVYWVNSLYGIAFGDDSSIANSVIATLLLLSSSLVSRHLRNAIEPSFLKFGMEVHWVNSLYGIAFWGELLHR